MTEKDYHEILEKVFKQSQSITGQSSIVDFTLLSKHRIPCNFDGTTFLFSSENMKKAIEIGAIKPIQNDQI